MRFRDLKPGDHIVFGDPGGPRLELIALRVVQGERPCLTALCLLDERHPRNEGQIHAAQFQDRHVWDGDGEVVANYG